MKQAKCNKCKKVKLVSVFSKCRYYNSSGGMVVRYYTCKKCTSECSKIYRERNKKRLRENLKRWKRENHDRHLEHGKKSQIKYRNNNQEKVKAHMIARKALLKGYCEICGDSGKEDSGRLERHHPNYYLPMDIITVCRSCHIKIHKEKSNEN